VVRSIGGEGIGKAKIDDDLTNPSTVTFAAGSGTAAVEVAIAADQTIGTDEIVRIGLYHDTAVTDATATGTIVNDDFAGVISVADVSVTEATTGCRRRASSRSSVRRAATGGGDDRLHGRTGRLVGGDDRDARQQLQRSPDRYDQLRGRAVERDGALHRHRRPRAGAE
jgi:hypothetical protein